MNLTRCSWFSLRSGGKFQSSRMRLCSSQSHYKTLEVGRNATKAEIKSAFLTLSKKHHPDRHPASESKDAHKNFREINEAYSVLIDPAKRSIYDQKFFGGASGPHFTSHPSTEDNKFGGFYQYNPRTNAYTYARAYKYYDLSEAEWEELHKRSGGFSPRKSNFKILRLLVLLMVSGTVLHSVRIYYSHRNYQRTSLEDSLRNEALYEAVRERGRNSTLQQQLDRLTDSQRHNSTELRTSGKDSEKKPP